MIEASHLYNLSIPDKSFHERVVWWQNGHPVFSLPTSTIHSLSRITFVNRYAVHDQSISTQGNCDKTAWTNYYLVFYLMYLVGAASWDIGPRLKSHKRTCAACGLAKIAGLE